MRGVGGVKGGGEQEKKFKRGVNGHWSTWSLSVPALETTRPQNICRRSNSPPEPCVFREKKGGRGARDKIPRGAMDFVLTPFLS